MKGFNVMFRFAYANQNNAAASAMCAEAASSCTSQSSRFNCIALGAIIMASETESLEQLPIPSAMNGIIRGTLARLIRAQ